MFRRLTDRAEERPAGAVDRQRQAVHPGAHPRRQRCAATVAVEGDSEHDGHVGQGNDGDQPGGQRHAALPTKDSPGTPARGGQSRTGAAVSQCRPRSWRGGVSHAGYRVVFVVTGRTSSRAGSLPQLECISLWERARQSRRSAISINRCNSSTSSAVAENRIRNTTGATTRLIKRSTLGAFSCG